MTNQEAIISKLTEVRARADCRSNTDLIGTTTWELREIFEDTHDVDEATEIVAGVLYEETDLFFDAPDRTH